MRLLLPAPAAGRVRLRGHDPGRLESGDYFGYATSVPAQGRYEGLTLGSSTSIYLDATSVLVKPDVARAQLQAEQASATKAAGKDGPSSTDSGTGSGTAPADTDKPLSNRACRGASSGRSGSTRSAPVAT